MPFTIRNSFEDGEFPVLYELEKECFAPEFRWHEPLFRQEITLARKQNLVWVAYDDRRIVGFLAAEKVRGGISIVTVNVTKSHRREGVASKLVSEFEKTMAERGYKLVRLEVYVENPAQVFWFDLGYRASGFRRNYYGKGMHAISMRKSISHHG